MREEGCTVRQWILLRGLARETAHWGDFAARLAHALPQDRVLALDLPGHGEWHHQASPASVPAMAQACRAALAARGVAPPYHLLAMSLGAMVATQWALEAPAEVAACVLVNTSLRPFSPFYQRLRPRNYGTALRLLLAGGSAEAVERTVLRMTSRRTDDGVDDVVRQWAAVRTQRPVSAGNTLRQLLAAVRYRAPASAPVPRMLLLASRQDGLVDCACSHAIAAAWGVPLVLHPWAGHDLPLDDPAWVVEQVAAWMRCAGGGPRPTAGPWASGTRAKAA